MNMNSKFLWILAFAFGLFCLSCEDPAPNDYQPRLFVEAYLFVEEPINGIKVLQTQPIDRVYSENDALIKDAKVIIIEGNDTLILQYSDSQPKGYFNSDTSYKVKAEKEYKIEIFPKSGGKISGITKTPGRTKWIKSPPSTLQYPKDTLSLSKSDDLEIEWEPVNKVNFYLVRVTCLDTLEYGIYLNPPTDEKNRRCYNAFQKYEQMYYNNTMWGFVGNTKSPTVWLSFKWFGKNNVDLLVPDDNMIKWYMSIYFTNSTYHEPNFNSVVGAEGVFASAYVLRADVFLLKNQP